jgi:Family of unknown function (DUF5336)
MTQPYSDAPAPGPNPTPTQHGNRSAMPDLRSLPPFDLGILIAGVLIFIVSFFPYYGASTSGAPTIIGESLGNLKRTVTAWYSYSTVALLLLLLATAVAAVAIFASASVPRLPVGLRWITAGLSALGGLLYVIRLFTLQHGSQSFVGVKVTAGVKWGGYLLLLIVLVHVACSVISALSSDEPVPWQQGSTSPTAPPAA